MIARLGFVLGTVAATAGLIGLLAPLLGFPPLILFAAPVVASLQLAGVRLALVAAASAAVIGDYFFVEPVRELTVHAQGLRLVVFLLLGTVLGWLVMRPITRREH